MKTQTSTYLTILTITVGLLVTYIYTNSPYFLYSSLAIGLVGVFSLFLSRKIEIIWFKLAEILGKFLPNILLIIIFFFILFPISVLEKIFSKEQALTLKNNRESTFVGSSQEFNADFFKKMW